MMAAASASSKINFITIQAAKVLADGAVAKAVELGLRIVVAITDNHGNLKYFERMDNTASGSVKISQQKAYTSASLPVSTKDLGTRSSQVPANPYVAIDGFLPLGGGLPIFINEVHVGAIGISGATPDLDETCARAGIDALLQSDLV